MGYCLITLASLFGVGTESTDESSRLEYFEKHIHPPLAQRCWPCHGGDKHEANLRLDSAAALALGGDAGSVVRPGDPEGSRLIQAIRYDGPLKMSPEKKLRESEIATLVRWVQQGATWPASRATSGQ